jgi:transposase InsO family protein
MHPAPVHENRHRWNDPSEWAWSKTQAHPAVISTDLYKRAQQTIKARGTNGARMRTTNAMGSQARDQGRHLGDRPPYGYRLVDAGPHPNRDHARWGRRLHRLDPDTDTDTAAHVRWIFAQRLTGASTASIARTLNDRGIPSPAAHDPGRNRHRSGTAWTVRTVAAILANPRYTGRQVWNRQRTDHRETVPGDKHTSCVLHTDRGSQFRSRRFVRALDRHRMVGSMGRVGAAGDNAAMESFFGLLQNNVLNRRTWATREQLRIAIVTWIERTYHRRRRQRTLARLTPIEYETIMTPPASQAA